METFLELPYVYPVSIINQHGMLVAETQNLDVITTDIGVQRWSFFIRLQTIWGYSQKAGELLTHRIEHSYDTPFKIPAPVFTNHRLPSNAPAITAAAATEGTNVLRVSSADTLQLAQIPVGNFIRIGDKDKVYIITGTKSGTPREWTISPQLRDPVSANERIHVNPELTVLYSAGSPQSLAFQQRGWVRPNIQVIEDLGD